MSASRSSRNGHSGDGLGSQQSGALSRGGLEKHSHEKISNGDGKIDHSHDPDPETMELYARARAQEREIQTLREQIAAAYVNEMKLLSEKYALEKKFADIRLAIDEKQNEATAYASSELARRKGDLEQNLKLAHELKETEDERYMFVSSMLGLLSSYDIWPPVLNATAISTYIKRLHDQLRWKLRTSEDKIREAENAGGINIGNASDVKDNNWSGMPTRQVPQTSMLYSRSSVRNHQGVSGRDTYKDGNALELTNNLSKYMHYNQPTSLQNLTYDQAMSQQLGTDNAAEFAFDTRRSSDRILMEAVSRTPNNDDSVASSASQGGPGIDGFQIVGEATPGNQLLGCGYPVRGTSLCMFQWVRHLPNGTTQYIEGATNPEYIVTADDVDKLIAVECIPMDEQGRQGDIVRLFANDQNKIKCDPEMQMEIDTYLSSGQAMFKIVIMLLDSSENWQSATLFLGRSAFEIKIIETGAILIAEKFSNQSSIKVPSGLSTQFVLTCSDGSTYPINTYDVRRRDTLVVTMRMFQSKSLEDKRKARA
ncbi:hypothetical protein EUGRSUZ_E01774 [Eucalyptus grandis]|uniref:Uncharacterized protein n=2 Tax=Eucalyptus grandis TaxID=71139 RepID=A0ACC3KW13_EUCGR|nr:hypothetical protein EUGRSUZ_E01774 [Eucalyptus grandis]